MVMVVPAGQCALGTVTGSLPSRSRTAGPKRPPAGGWIGAGVLSNHTSRSAGTPSIRAKAMPPARRPAIAISFLMFFSPLEVNWASRAGSFSS